ncbi:2-hydroxyacid dehydrogenase [Pirellulaceae bacterium SH467]|jgi:D-lactate dehydrogenase
MDVAVFDTKVYDREHLLGAMHDERLHWRFHDFRLSPETAQAAQGCEAICIFVNDRCDREVLDRLRQQGVRIIALRCAGFNNVDLNAAKEFGIAVVRVPAYSPHAVAEHTVGLLLAVNRKLHRAYNRVREQNFALHGLVGFDIAGKTIGIIGTGRIGKVTAQILRGFDAKVIAFDEYPDRDWAERSGVEYVDKELLFRQSDILSLHIPLTDKTYHLLDATSLGWTKPGVTIVNTSRGKLIDTSALIQYLKSGHIGSVALDVYEEEEGVFFEDLSGKILQDDELALLLTFPNVLLTAHQAFLTREALSEIARVTSENLLAFQNKKVYLPGTQLV